MGILNYNHLTMSLTNYFQAQLLVPTWSGLGPSSSNPILQFLAFILIVNPNQFSQVSKMSPLKKIFIALFILEVFKHFETYLFLTHFGG